MALPGRVGGENAQNAELIPIINDLYIIFLSNFLFYEQGRSYLCEKINNKSFSS